MQPGHFENILWYLSVVGAAVLLSRMYAQGLAGTYRMLSLYLCADVLADLAGLAFTAQNDQRAVALTYIVTQGIKVILALFVAMELFRLALAEHPALARFGQKVIAYFFAAGLVIGALNVWFGSRYQGSEWTGEFIVFERSMDLTVMVALLLMSGFLLWYPVRMRRNVGICMAGFALYSFQRWAGLLLTALFPGQLRGISAAMMGFSAALFAFWIIVLQRRGEEISTVAGHRWDPGSAAHLAQQLEHINAYLKTLENNKAAIID